MPVNGDFKPHIFLVQKGKVEKYTYPKGGGGKNAVIPERDRCQHGEYIRSQLSIINQVQDEVESEAESYDLESPLGIQVAFASFPGVELAVESLADANQGIELLNVRSSANHVLATIFVPQGKLAAIERKLHDYFNYKKDKNGNPRDNRKLFDAIQSLSVAAIEALWTDRPEVFPKNSSELIWWEVWLPVLQDRNAVVHDFKMLASQVGITVTDYVLEFPERSVLLAKGNKKQFSSSILLLSQVAELRKAKETAAFFDELPPVEQPSWADNLLNRTQITFEKPPYICILDSGTNIGHPLLQPFIDDADQHAVDPDWTPNDDIGHGTGMAGLAIWSDLTDSLSTEEVKQVSHRLESVKLLRYVGDNEGKHLGIITSDGIALPEINDPTRTRIYAMALSSTDGRDQGKPSAWSSTVDSLVVDYLGDNQSPRLMLVCAGNTGHNLSELTEYPHHNIKQDIHDPGQSWNAITVGAYTTKSHITDEGANAYSPLAPFGGLSPYSTTSVSWERGMPIKPEVVFEGGNVGFDQYGCAGLASLKLLTTHHNSNERLFSTFEATSAATALASKLAAEIYARYPKLWPETVRALIVHSAQWTSKMQSQFQQPNMTKRKQAQYLVRCVGFGVPNLERALWSLSNSLSLIIEDELQPFHKEKGNIRTRDMHIHYIPWPKDILLGLGEIDVEMTITLSYFIEPNPSSRNVSGKYSYPSHQLCFDVSRPTESVSDFKGRISQDAREEGETRSKAPDDPNWVLGKKFRHKGSIHRDTWTGTAADLALRDKIAVYPSKGWWRTRKKLQKWDKKARYSMIVSILAPKAEVDLYSEVLNAVNVEQAVTASIPIVTSV